MNGVGFCWLSRAAGMAQHLSDILKYVQEKLGSRPTRAVLTGSGVSSDVIAEAFKTAMEMSDNAGLSRYGMIPVLANKDAPLTMELTDLASRFEHFEDVNSAVRSFL